MRIVYYGTACGLNENLCSPSFFFPTAKVLSRFMSHSCYSLELEVADMFYNFPLSDKLKPYSGIDVSIFEINLRLS